MPVAAAGALAQVGVRLIVKDILGFKNSINAANGILKTITSTAQNVVRIGLAPLNLALKGLGNMFSWFGGVIQRIVEYAFGFLLGNAIRDAIRGFEELIQQTIETGNQFLLLELRLNGINFAELSEQGMAFAQAMSEAAKMTKEQVRWLQALATATPFDVEDITETYALGRALGFSDAEMRILTQDISNFASALALPSDAIERILYNFGQMKQRGKITRTELRDLAKGALVPINELLARVAKRMGITVTALDKMISSTKGVDAQIFIDVFSEMVRTEPQFIGAAARMSKTLLGATNNLKEFFRSVMGGNLVAPILGAIGAKLAEIVDTLVYFDSSGNMVITQVWKDISDAAEQLGASLSDVISKILDKFLPSAGDVTNALLTGMNNMTTWLDTNKTKIIEWADSAITKIKEVWAWLFGTAGTPGQNRPSKQTPFDQSGRDLPMVEGGWESGDAQYWQTGASPFATFMQDMTIPATDPKQGAFGKFFAWLRDDVFPVLKSESEDIYENIIKPHLLSPGQGWIDLYDALKETATTVGQIGVAVWDVIKAVFSIEPNKSFTDWLKQDLNPALAFIKTYVTENKQDIVWMAEGLWGLAKAAFWGSVAVLALLYGFQIAVAAIIVLGLAMYGAWIQLLYNIMSYLSIEFAGGVQKIMDGLREHWDTVWTDLGNIVKRVVNEMIIKDLNELIQTIETLFQWLGMEVQIPSIPELEMTKPGGGSGRVPRGDKVSPTTTSNSFNLTVNTGARTSTVIQDFAMLQSMV